MLRSQDYSKGWSSPDDMHRVSLAIENQYRNARIRAADLIITVVGAGTGQVEVAPAWLDGAVLSRSTARIAVDDAKAQRAFVAAVLRSPLGRRQVLNSLKEGAQPVVSCRDVAEFLVPCPPLDEQRAIAAALSDVDALVGALDRLIAKKRDLKQAAVQQLLTGQTRLPGFTVRSGCKESEIGTIPDDWQVLRIEQIAMVRGGKRLPAGAELLDGQTPHPYLRVTDMRPGGVVLDNIKYVPKHAFSSIRNYRIFTSDLFISVAGTLGLVGKIPAALDGANLTENADRITDIQCDRDYLLYHLMSKRIQSSIEAIRTVGAQPKLALGRIRQFSVPMPPNIDEQRAIAAVLSDMDAEITALEARRDKTRLLKQGMMQELLTGKTRLV